MRITSLNNNYAIQLLSKEFHKGSCWAGLEAIAVVHSNLAMILKQRALKGYTRVCVGAVLPSRFPLFQSSLSLARIGIMPPQLFFILLTTCQCEHQVLCKALVWAPIPCIFIYSFL